MENEAQFINLPNHNTASKRLSQNSNPGQFDFKAHTDTQKYYHLLNIY